MLNLGIIWALFRRIFIITLRKDQRVTLYQHLNISHETSGARKHRPPGIPGTGILANKIKLNIEVKKWLMLKTVWKRESM